MARVVVVGTGFAGFSAARALEKVLPPEDEIVAVNPRDYFLYLPLLPEVSAGILDPRRVAVSLSSTLRRARLVLGTGDELDLAGHVLHVRDPEGHRSALSFDRIILTVGSVNRLLPVPGLVQYAHGFRSIAEAVYLRDHIVRQLDMAAATDDPAERDDRCTFVVVGAGYTGTEVCAQGQLQTRQAARRYPRLRHQRMRWILIDIAPRILPDLGPHMSGPADRILRRRGVELRLETSVEEVTAEEVRLSDGDTVRTRTLVWCVGVRPDPFVERLGQGTTKGRLVVDEYLQVPDHADVYACGDAAAVPDLTRPGEITPMTAQHAQRQGVRAAQNVAASLGHGAKRPYRHHDLGFVVDLGAWSAVANPVHVPLSGIAAGLVTRGYHLLVIPGNRARIAGSWVGDAVLRPPDVGLDLVSDQAAALEPAPTTHGNANGPDPA